MKLFLISSLFLLLVPLALSNVIAKRSENAFKMIYDQGFYLSEMLGENIFALSAIAFRNSDGEATGMSKLKIGTGIDQDNLIGLELVHNSERPTLDDLSFVMESMSTETQECDLAPAFKNLTEHCEGPIRVRELTDEEKSKAQARRKQLAASLEEKKREIGGVSDETGEFRLLFDNVTERVIVEAIGTHFFELMQYPLGYGIHLHTSSWEKDPQAEKELVVKDVDSFAAENILEDGIQDCEDSPLKDSMKYCLFIEFRPLTKEERSRLDGLKSLI